MLISVVTASFNRRCFHSSHSFSLISSFTQVVINAVLRHSSQYSSSVVSIDLYKMNTILVVHAVIALVLVHGLNGLYVQSKDKAELYDADSITSVKPRDNQICKPWSMQSKYCNNCFCFARGFGWVCNTKNCTHSLVGHLKLDAVISKAREQADQGRRYKREISEESHHKVEFGKDRKIYTRVRRSVGKHHICVPRSTKMMACNECVCNANGSAWFCTMKQCSETINSDTVQIRY